MSVEKKDVGVAIVIALLIGFGAAQASKRPGAACAPGFCLPTASGELAKPAPRPMGSNLSKADIAKVYGKIQYVSSFPDYKVQAVTAFEDLRVQLVDNFPDGPGKWQIVDSFPDFKIQLVESFPDFTVKFVNSFPGPASAPASPR